MTNPDIDIFVSLVETVETKRLADEVEAQRADQLRQSNEQVVVLGRQAVEAGLTQESLTTGVWDTVRRHRAMLQRIGISRTGPTLNENRKEFYVMSKVTKLAPDFGVVLAQREHRPHTVSGFWAIYEDAGREAALDAYARPRSTVIYMIFELMSS